MDKSINFSINPNISDQSKNFSIAVINAALGTAPMMLSFFIPCLNIITVGMLRTPYSVAVLGLSSVFILKNLTRPAYSRARSSTRGAIIRHGPHHGAQKSTPRCPEIHEHWNVTLQHNLFPCLVSHFASW